MLHQLELNISLELKNAEISEKLDKSIFYNINIIMDSEMIIIYN